MSKDGTAMRTTKVMTAKDLANKVHWEGGVVSALEYGIRSDEIDDPEVIGVSSGTKKASTRAMICQGLLYLASRNLRKTASIVSASIIPARRAFGCRVVSWRVSTSRALRSDSDFPTACCSR